MDVQDIEQACEGHVPLSVCIAPTDGGLQRRLLPQEGSANLRRKIFEIACLVRRNFIQNRA